MARAERMLTDEQLQTELDIYNPLIPEPGRLSATLFIELTSEDQLREWLPKLVGIERSIELCLGGDGGEAVGCVPEESHDQQLTPDEITASVHYIRFELTPRQVEKFASGPVTLRAVHPEYREEVGLADETHAELLADLRG